VNVATRAALVGALVAIASPANAEPTTLTERAKLEVQPSGKGFKRVAIENPLGDVKVEGYDGTAIQIETKKQAPDEEGLDRLRISLVPNPDGTVRITTTVDGGRENKPLPRSAVRIDLVVRAPRDAHIEAISSAGSLEVSNMDAGGDLDTASGRITVRNVAGGLSTSTVSGATSLTQVFGSVDAASLGSNLDFDSIGGEKLVASATSGRIAGRRVRSRHVELTTVNGKIILEGEASLKTRVMIASMHGDIEVRMRRSYAGGLVVRGRGSKVSLGAPTKVHPDGFSEAHLGKFTTGSAPALVELRSQRGNVQFAIIE
jgi:hypothetical protein